MTHVSFPILAVIALMCSLAVMADETECDIGEIYAACGRQCEGTCASPIEPKKCQIIRCDDKSKACRCDLNSGFVRNSVDQCVQIADCA